MSVIVLLIPLSLLLAAGFLGAFLWAVRGGQYEDTATPPLRVLTEDTQESPSSEGTHQPSFSDED